MKTIIKYKADDGTEFSDFQKCGKYEDTCHKIDEAMMDLKKAPDTCDFTNGDGYVQHLPHVVERTKRALLEIAFKVTKHKWCNPETAMDKHPSYPSRIIGDSGHDYLCEAWGRIYRIDKQGREWGQAYYVDHPNEAKQFEIK